MFFNLYFRRGIYNFVGSNCDFVPRYVISGNYWADSHRFACFVWHRHRSGKTVKR